MVVEHRADTILMDREALSVWTRRSVEVIRKRCVVLVYDEIGRALYDARASAQLLSAIQQRAPRRPSSLMPPKKSPRDPNGVGYHAVHARLRRGIGKASTMSCVDCGARGADWSYDHMDEEERLSATGSPFSLEPECYQPRCRKCHLAFDRHARDGACANP